MKIIGHGIDLQDVQKVEKLLANPDNDWLDGAFTQSEQTSADAPPNIAQYFAGRFAAKEAVAKALGTGFTDEVTWLDIEVYRKPSGAPHIRLSGGAAEVAQALGVTGWFLSLSHSGTFCIASAIAIAEEQS